MKKVFITLLAAAAIVSGAWANEANTSNGDSKDNSSENKQEENDFDRWYIEAAVGMLMPGCGNSLNRGFNMVLRGGYNFSEQFSFELEGQIAPNMTTTGVGGGQKVRGLGAQFLWHPFDFSRIDPFISFGAGSYFASSHVFGGGDNSWAIGPRVGIGLMYHLTDHWAIRSDARATMLIDDPVGMMFDWDIGVQFSFGGSDKDDKSGAGAGVVAMAAAGTDSDGDGISDADEKKYGTDPHNADTDNDGLTDGEEINTYHTDPLSADTDSDQLTDGEEVKTYHTDPLKRDTDGGGVSDGHEVQVDKTNPLDGADDLCLFSLELNFDYDKTDVATVYHDRLDKIAKLIIANTNATAVIEGHADRRNGSTMRYNKPLSEKRAAAVRDVLVSKGVPAERLTVKGYGFRRPKVRHDLAKGNPENRRVEIYIRGVSGEEGDIGAKGKTTSDNGTAK